jgi:CheY-like chemotaxis protein
VATELLADLGAEVEVAVNGAVAVERVASAAYDLVLMDMQMPVMDGITATERIRAQGNTLPIVAMTANAMAGDRDRVIAAGMNDHLAKPIDPDELAAMVGKWGRPAKAEVPRAAPAAAPHAAPAAIVPRAAPAAAPRAATPADASGEDGIPSDIPGLDVALGLKRVRGKRPLYLDMLRKFAAGQRNAVAEIRKAFRDDDATTAQRIAHTLKGLAGNVGAPELATAAAAVEAAAKKGRAVEADLKALAAKLEALVGHLDRRLRAPSAPAKVNATEGNAAEGAAVLEQLRRLLAANDAEAEELLNAHLELLRVLMPERVNELARMVNNFDFDKALALLPAAAAPR